MAEIREGYDASDGGDIHLLGRYTRSASPEECGGL